MKLLTRPREMIQGLTYKKKDSDIGNKVSESCSWEVTLGSKGYFRHLILSLPKTPAKENYEPELKVRAAALS